MVQACVSSFGDKYVQEELTQTTALKVLSRMVDKNADAVKAQMYRVRKIIKKMGESRVIHIDRRDRTIEVDTSTTR